VHWSATFDGGRLSTAEGPLRRGDIILLHFKPGLGLNLLALLQVIQAAGLHPAQLEDYIHSAPATTLPTTTVPKSPTAPPPTTAPVLPEGVGAPVG
jgi:hypothetical protein